MKRLVFAATVLLFPAFSTPVPAWTAHSAVPIVVSTTDDGVAGSLRDVMSIADANPDLSVIEFNIPGPGPHTIALTSPLPTLLHPVIIDGFSEPGSARNTNPVGQPSNAVILITLNGAAAGANATGLYLRNDATVAGLAIINFSGMGMLLVGGTFTVEGCHIGVNAAGGTAGPNVFNGIYLDESYGSHIGGVTPGARNVISGNGRDGIAVNKSGNCWIQGNYIGVAADGVTPVPNIESGVALLDDAIFHTIGGAPASNCSPAPQGINLIAHNGGDGIEVSEIGAVDPDEISILSNIIHSNGGLGIDLGPNGITLNDFQDVDAGGNGRQNYPNISSAEDSTIKFTLGSTPNTTFVVQFFRNASCDGTGNGEGQVFMSQMNVTTNANGSSGEFMTCGLIPPNSIVTATATAPNGSTSEFSPCVTSRNTTLGTDIWVGVPDEDGALVANLFFEQVTSTGNTFVTPGAMPPEPVPGAFFLSDPPVYYDISTTAGYNTALGVDVCLRYDETTLAGDEADVLLLHYDTALGEWVDVTTTRDTAANFVCGHVSTLSPFVAAVPNTLVGVGVPKAPAQFALRANVPNPFNPVTSIAYDVPAGGAHVAITVFDVAGRKVRTLVDRRRDAGTWTVQWNGSDDRGRGVASGVYFYRMQAGSFTETRRMVLLK
jgi:hypothetical protein